MPPIVEINEPFKWICIKIIFEIIFAYLDCFLFINLFKIQATNKTKAKIILVDGILRTISIVLIPNPYYRALNLLSTIILFKIFFKSKIEKCILGEVINSITILFGEVIFSKLLCVLLSNVEDYASGIYDCTYSFYLMLSISIFRLMICYIIKKKNINLRISNNLSKKNRNNIIVVSVLGCMIVFFNAAEMTLYIRDFPYSIFILDMISIVTCLWVSMRSIVKITIMEEQDIKINELESYNKTLSIMYDGIRGFRHDFSNFVQALDGYTKINDMDGVRKMIGAVTKECKMVNNMEILDPNIINNPAVYSIITNKYYLAQENKITMSIEVMTDLQEIKDYSYEFCRILGILIDNAIESAKECENKVVNIRFIKDFKLNRKLVIIENSYDTSLEIDIDKIFEKGYTSKNDTKNEHGLGLWTVRKILNQCENLNLFTTKGELFCQQLEIYQ